MNQTIVTITKGMEEHRINTEKGMMELRNNSTGRHIWLFPDELKREEYEFRPMHSSMESKKYEVITDCKHPNSPEIQQRLKEKEELEEKEIQQRLKEKKELKGK